MESNHNKSISKYLFDGDHFFCISYFEGDYNWIKKLNPRKYIVYNKGFQDLPSELKNIRIKNVGYNLYSYLLFIIENYDNLPGKIIFCKNNIFKRHIKKEYFEELITRNTYTSLDEIYEKHKYPISIKLSDGSFTEINNSWYKFKYERLYFADYNEFYKFIFNTNNIPHYLKFAPGANYLVTRENILLRTKNFYLNLLLFISHSQFSCESHFLERSLDSIWQSNIYSSEIMDKKIGQYQKEDLIKKCKLLISKESFIIRKIKDKLIFKIGEYFIKLLEIF